ncbi:L-serine ammonia-lyase, iron-sulfur-dependent, subunit alpha [Alistipes sp.]|uniref:L-serine ammonia-lyase, iron-sulfur-dependent, subunit alpha n=1 Tax=Alistipes sp. TaxID=1872444 RepID=UPI00307C8199
MESLKELYRIGSGPSSSHTMGPKRAAEQFTERCRDVDAYRVTLYGSLAATGKGHLTDVAILSVLEPVAPTQIVWKPEVVLPFHPNGMLFEGLKGGQVVDAWTIFSVGGGALANEASRLETPQSIYPLSTISEIKEWCYHEGKTFWEYVSDCEGPEIWDYLDTVWETMCATIQRGLNNDGVLPGGLKVARKASTYWVKSKSYTDSLSSRAKIYAYALATSEENASGGTVVTAPTCGSSGVMPAVLYHLSSSRNFLRVRILRALATAGLFGNVAKTNSSISGAEVGCQGEVGVACAMAAAAACQLFGGTPSQIEYAAEMGLEHHLGLTCDPVCGLVQVPCIERNAIAAARAFDANAYATLSDGSHMVSFDKVVEVMNETGHALPSLYRETSEGGLAKRFKR